MEQKLQAGRPAAALPGHEATLDLVIPFTTPELTRAALAAADRMSPGLNAAVRLVRVQVVPYPLDLAQSPVYIGFLREQLAQFHSRLPLNGEILLARDLARGLSLTLTPGSVVILATRKRPWRTRTERLAEELRRGGHKIVLVSQRESERCSTLSTAF